MSVTTRGSKGSKYTDEHRRQAVALYLVKGSLEQVSKLSGIHARTLSDWKRSDWWEPLCSELHSEIKDKTLAQLNEIIDKAHAETMDRLENGDPMVYKGEVTGRAPLKGREAAIIAAVAIDKRQILLNQPTSITASTDGMASLAEQFAKLAQQHREKDVVAVQDGQGEGEEKVPLNSEIQEAPEEEN